MLGRAYVGNRSLASPPSSIVLPVSHTAALPMPCRLLASKAPPEAIPNPFRAILPPCRCPAACSVSSRFKGAYF